MATSSEEMLLRLGMNADGIKKGMADANRSVKSGLDSLKSEFVRAFSAGAVLGAMQNVLNKFDEIQDRADNLGVGTNFLQGMQQVAKRDAVGGQETFNKGISELSVKMGQAKEGTEEAIQKFEKYGITLKQIASLNAEQMFYVIADKIKAIPDSTQRAAASFDLLGKAGKNLAGVLANGSAELKNMVDAADKLDAHHVKMLAEAKDTIEDVTNSAQIGIGTILGTIGDIAKWFGEMSTGINYIERAHNEGQLKAIQNFKKHQLELGEITINRVDKEAEKSKKSYDQRQVAAEKELESLTKVEASIEEFARDRMWRENALINLKQRMMNMDKESVEYHKLMAMSAEYSLQIEVDKTKEKEKQKHKDETQQKFNDLQNQKAGVHDQSYMPTEDQIRRSRKFGGTQRQIDDLKRRATGALLEGNRELSKQYQNQIEGYDVPLTAWQQAQNKAQEDYNQKMGINTQLPFPSHIEGLKETLSQAGLVPEDQSLTNIDKNIAELLTKAKNDGIKIADSK